MSIYKFISVREKLMKGIFFLCAFFSIFALAIITFYLLYNGVPFIHEIGFFNFIFGMKWSPISSEPSYGIFPMIVTTIYVTVFSTIIGVIIGLFTAIAFYRFLPKKLVTIFSQMINLLAGIPSVIYGLFGMTVIVPFIRDYISDNGFGYGILSASLVLALMILPTIVSVTYDALKSVDELYYEGALALGATKEMATFRVVVPNAKSGIFAGVVLSIGRALGETMAVIMVIGGSANMPNSLFQSVRTLTANIAMGATELSGDKTTLSALIATGVVLFVLALLINVCFSLIKRGKKNGITKKVQKK